MSTITESTTCESDLVRLHITPLNPDLYQKIIPSSIRIPESKVSFHVVQTFPERGFGYLEVTKADAETLKRKLNGSILKGTKIRIEEAKPVMKRKVETGEEPVKERNKRTKTRESGTKKRDVVMPGYELHTDRHVKRGWTDNKAPKKLQNSVTTTVKDAKATNEKKLLFKTVVPPNVNVPAEDKSKQRGEKRGEKKKKRTKKGEVVVEEFGKNRSTFAVSHASSIQKKAAVAYEDGIGWVDENGEVVEPEPERLQRRHEMQDAQNVDTGLPRSKPPKSSEQSLATIAETTLVESSTQPIENSESTSEQDSDSSSVASSSDATTSSDDESDETLDDSVPKEVHPLEALYKRAVKPDAKDQLAPINTSFSFFDAAEDAVDEEATMAVPQTPHTKQDLEWRHQRSAAPTPDTAAIDGRFGFPFGPPESDGEEHAPIETPIVAATQRQQMNGEREESAFRKFFYEKRGDTDRAWKKRRREMKKLQRQRENRRLSRKVV